MVFDETLVERRCTFAPTAQEASEQGTTIARPCADSSRRRLKRPHLCQTLPMAYARASLRSPKRSSAALTWATVIAVATVLIIMAWHIAFGPLGRPSTLEAITVLVLLLAFIQATAAALPALETTRPTERDAGDLGQNDPLALFTAESAGRRNLRDPLPSCTEAVVGRALGRSRRARGPSFSSRSRGRILRLCRGR